MFLMRVKNGLRVALRFAIITGIIMLLLELGVASWITASIIGFLYGYNGDIVS